MSATEEAQAPVQEEEAPVVCPEFPIASSMHRLQYPWTLWFFHKSQGKKVQNYDKALSNIGTFRTVEHFWMLYSHLVRPSNLPINCDYHIFKEGIKPMWEDEANKQGGKWMIRVRKSYTSWCWENLVLALLGNELETLDAICGAVVSIRYQEDIISVWNRDYTDREKTLRLRDEIRAVLSLPQTAVFEYKCHDAALKDNSSYRNTDKFQ